jgi:hypothetical protein
MNIEKVRWYVGLQSSTVSSQETLQRFHNANAHSYRAYVRCVPIESVAPCVIPVGAPLPDHFPLHWKKEKRKAPICTCTISLPLIVSSLRYLSFWMTRRTRYLEIWLATCEDLALERNKRGFSKWRWRYQLYFPELRWDMDLGAGVLGEKVAPGIWNYKNSYIHKILQASLGEGGSHYVSKLSRAWAARPRTSAASKTRRQFFITLVP